MNRHLVSIGVALVDAGVRPDTIGWLIELLGSVRRTYLPLPGIESDARQTVVHFRVESRELVLVAVRPRLGGWLRIAPDGSQDSGSLGGPASSEVMPWLFAWLLDGPGSGPASVPTGVDADRQRREK